MSKPMKAYLKDCRRLFPFYDKREKEFFKRFENDILSACDDEDTISYASIVERFGTPKSVLESYINSCENDYLLRKMKVKVFVRRVFILLFIGITLIALLELHSIKQGEDQKIITEEEIVTYE